MNSTLPGPNAIWPSDWTAGAPTIMPDGIRPDPRDAGRHRGGDDSQADAVAATHVTLLVLLEPRELSPDRPNLQLGSEPI